MANSNLKTLSEIFNDKIFKIPVYQRGYSWGEAQLEDLWREMSSFTMLWLPSFIKTKAIT
jgi:uncharacterized protein with ParB-like and HNH nuclease domain